MTSSGGRRRRVLSLAASLLITAAILGLQFADEELGNRVVLFYALPVVLIADAFGWRAGAVAGLLAFGIDLGRDAVQGNEAALGLHLGRGVVLVLIGVLVGSLADRTRRALSEAKRTARHFELSHDLACTVDADGRFLEVNDSWHEALGWTRPELLGSTFADFVHPHDREATAEEAGRIGSGGSPQTFINRYRDRDGGWHQIEWTSRADSDTGLIYAAARDVTDRVAAEVAREEAEERFRRAFDDSPIGIALVGLRDDEAGKLLEANEALGAMLGYAPEELVGKRTLREFTHPDDVEMAGAGMERIAAGELTTFRCELRVVPRSADPLWVELSTSVLHGADGEPLYRLSQIHDIDIRRRTEDQLRRLADHDSLTDLHNRRRFRTELERELDPARPSQGAVLMIDVDGLKQINDRLGHAAGDAVLVGVADQLRDSLRSGDIAARLGGDEFAVLLRRVGRADAVAVADKLLTAARARFGDLRGPSAGLGGLSIGVAVFGEEGGGTTSPEQLLEAADRAMYEAKADGGRQTVVA